jgi:hypothetical protein
MRGARATRSSVEDPPVEVRLGRGFLQKVYSADGTVTHPDGV